MPETKKTAKTATKKAENKKEQDKKATPNAKGDLFAVIATGGKQYKVSVGDTIKIEKIKGEHSKGDTLTFDKVLLVDDGSATTIGTPHIKGAKVEAELTKVARAKKVEVIKYKAKSNYFKRNGHRQPYFEIKVTAIK